MNQDTDVQSVHRLVTFLGLGRLDSSQNEYVYDTVEWTFDECRARRTPYVCRALAELLRPKEITVLGTAMALDKHRPKLEKALREGNCPSPRFVEIPKGESAGELWEQFQLIKGALRGSDGPVIFDITHGFRSQPFFAAAISAFIRAVDEEPPDLRICYAAYEAKDDTGRAPIWELTEFGVLLDWAQALRMFLRTGRAQEAAEETTRLGRALAKAWVESGQQGERPNLDKLGAALRDFGADLETLRTGDLLVGRSGRKSSVTMLCASAQYAKDDVAQHVPPLADVLDRVVAMASPLAGERGDLSGDSGRAVVEALAELYLRLGRHLEAAATVREGWINLYADRNALCPGAEDFDAQQRKCAENRANERDKTFREVTDRRNDLLHAQYRASPQKADNVVETVKGLVEKYKTAEVEPASPLGRGGCCANLSNHPSEKWDAGQTAAALALAKHIVDVPFPSVPPEADEKAINALAEECMAKIPPASTHALVQGEFTLTVELVRRLQARGITCLAATTERNVEETDDGGKTSTFRFVRFREYS